jgi:uncharacterized protein (DUF1810 family)
MDDSFDLQRFVDAQASVYPQVVSELRAGRKRSHWMWFIFPQIAGLGHSAMARKFAIRSREEATAYLAHPILGPRLRECTDLVLAVENRSITEILGSPDDIKFRSSMTLFADIAGGDEMFRRAGRKVLFRRFGPVHVGHPAPSEMRLEALSRIRVDRYP